MPRSKFWVSKRCSEGDKRVTAQGAQKSVKRLSYISTHLLYSAATEQLQYLSYSASAALVLFMHVARQALCSHL